MVTALGDGTRESFVRFYESVNQPLFSFILSIVQDQHDAEDILQETYMKIRASAHLYEPRGKPLAWIFTVARNMALMHLRRNKANHIDLDEIEERNPLVADNPDQHERMALQTVLKELDEKERSVILLHAVSGYTHQEIASSLGMPLATALSKYYRGLRKLKARLQALEGRLNDEPESA